MRNTGRIDSIRGRTSVEEESVMSEFRKLIGLAPAVLLATAFLVGTATAGDYDGAKLLIDATVVDTGTAVNDSTTTMRAPAAGDTVKFELYVPAAASGTTYAFNLKLTTSDSLFTTNFKVESVTPAWAGGLVAGSDDSWGVLGVSPVTVPASGHIATVVMTALVDVADTVTIGLLAGETTIADPNFANDPLDVTGAVITLTSGPKIAADVDITSAIPLLANSSVTVTVTATGFAADATITWTVDESATSTASISTVEGTGTNAITATGPGSSTLTVSASDGTESTNTLTIIFSQQDAAELASFGGELVDDRVVLNWSTASQTNNAGWRVLRSVDGENYEPVGEFVQGAGTADALLSYVMEDAVLPTVDKVYYQLEQVDLDGSVTRSSAIEVLLGARMPLPTEFATNVFPNPFNPSTTISYDLPNEAFVSIVIYDAIGQEVRRLVSEQTAAGRYRAQWDARDNLGRAVGSGVYIAKVEAGSFSSSQKMLLLK
jgi:hypothetical protein